MASPPPVNLFQGVVEESIYLREVQSALCHPPPPGSAAAMGGIRVASGWTRVIQQFHGTPPREVWAACWRPFCPMSPPTAAPTPTAPADAAATTPAAAAAAGPATAAATCSCYYGSSRCCCSLFSCCSPFSCWSPFSCCSSFSCWSPFSCCSSFSSSAHICTLKIFTLPDLR